ncbi:hypothetical protein FQN57_004372 [Myotisia sp. PD_48]|nr:hypothetical protein FQN57_004372 [Myotisia sp. PD_48]
MVALIGRVLCLLSLLSFFVSPSVAIPGIHELNPREEARHPCQVVHLCAAKRAVSKFFSKRSDTAIPSVSNARRGPDLIEKDVVVIGGGAGGTFTAVSLLNKGKNVLLIEKEDHLGGHTDSYVDPATGLAGETGVEGFCNITVVRKFFDTLNVAYRYQSLIWDKVVYHDFDTGEPVKYPFNPDHETERRKYMEVLGRYPYLFNGYEDLPDPIPAELLMPFGIFAEQNGIKGVIIDMIFATLGFSDILQQPTLYILKAYFSQAVMSMNNGFVVSKDGGNLQLYRTAQELLNKNQGRTGSSLLLSSTVTSVRRTAAGVQMTVRTPSGLVKVKAKKLVVAMPPQLHTLAGFDLDRSEIAVFRQLRPGGGGPRDLTGGAIANALMRNTNLTANTNYLNVSPVNKANLPDLPATAYIHATKISGIYSVKYVYGADENNKGSFTDEEVKVNMVKDIIKLQEPGSQEPEPEIIRFSRHSPMFLGVETEKIRRGFYKEMVALQGYRHTYYTGAAFVTHYSSLIWHYTDTVVVPKVLSAL